MTGFIGSCRSLILDDYTSGKRLRCENQDCNIRQLKDETITKKHRSFDDESSDTYQTCPTPVSILKATLINGATQNQKTRKVSFKNDDTSIDELTHALAKLRLPSFNICLTAEEQGWIIRTVEHVTLHIPPEAALLMSDFELRYFSEAYPDITSLCLPRSNYISDLGLGYIIDNGGELRSIEISRCEHISDATLIAISYNCPKLTAFSVRECKNVTNVGVMALATRCIDLITLNLDGINALNDSSLHVIGRCLPELTELTLSNCTKITRKGFEAVLKGCQKLETLNLLGCRQVNDQWVDAIIKAKAPLTMLDIQRCNVTVKGIAKLYAHYPNLTLQFDQIEQQQVSQG